MQSAKYYVGWGDYNLATSVHWKFIFALHSACTHISPRQREGGGHGIGRRLYHSGGADTEAVGASSQK